MVADREKKPTIYDLAKALGVSSGTVNRALHNKPEINAETKRRVLEMAEKMNFKLNPVAQSMRRKTFHIAAMDCCTVPEFGRDVMAGVRSEISQIGDFNVRGDSFTTLDLCNSDFTSRLDETAEQFINDGIDAVILHTNTDNDDMRNCVRKMLKKGIIVACVTSRVTGVDVLYVGIDSVAVGHMAGEVLNLCCPGKKVGILIGTTNLTPHIGYLQGFQKVNGDCPFESVHIYAHSDDAYLVEESTRKMLEENPDLSGLYIATASSGTALRVINEICPDNSLNIVTTDLLEETWRFLKNRTIRATIFQDPFLQGKTVAGLVYKHLCGETDEKEIILKPQIIFPSDAK